MSEQINKNEEVNEVNLKRLVDTVLRRAWLVILAAIVGAVVTFGGTYFFVTPLYESTAMFYVNNNSISVGEASLSISSADITASKSLVDTYIVILNTRETMMDVMDYAEVSRSYSDIVDMIEAEAVNDTEIFQVTVTSPDPAEAEKLANSIAYILPKRISSIVEGTSAKIVDSAVIPSEPSSPNLVVNTLVGFLLGLVICVGAIVLKELFNITIREEDDVTQICKYPLLTSVPDMASSSKGGYDYRYDQEKGKKKPASGSHGNKPVLIGSGMSFAATEAYKLLRTKLQFSFADERSCHVIGLSSALSGEGKSLTAVNLAYTLSQLDKRVILIDCDMRRPTLADKLNIARKPGLSSFLSGQADIDGLVQFCGIKDDEQAFHVIAAGPNPPNPVELLSSARMSKVLKGLRHAYDYVILDLPPIGEVTDALAVVKEVDGMLLVVRQNYCNRVVLSDAVRQFSFVDAKILGVVLNCTNDHGTKYGKSYYKRYYKTYNTDNKKDTTKKEAKK